MQQVICTPCPKIKTAIKSKITKQNTDANYQKKMVPHQFV